MEPGRCLKAASLNEITLLKLKLCTTTQLLFFDNFLFLKKHKHTYITYKCKIQQKWHRPTSRLTEYCFVAYIDTNVSTFESVQL